VEQDVRAELLRRAELDQVARKADDPDAMAVVEERGGSAR
jgi:hypothetical protein